MWESKDIQLRKNYSAQVLVVVWCGNQKIYNSLSLTLSPSWVVVWCGNQKIYNCTNKQSKYRRVVVWCGNQKIYNDLDLSAYIPELWFDVGIKRYTTQCELPHQGVCCGLMWESKDIQHFPFCKWKKLVVVWCGNQKIYNTIPILCASCRLWFDVGIKRYTTVSSAATASTSCGLMWESKDIQHMPQIKFDIRVVVWCGNQKIYNQNNAGYDHVYVVVWCGNQKIYNVRRTIPSLRWLWFDVGIKRYTTGWLLRLLTSGLWFDVGIKRYTTDDRRRRQCRRCGLMWESKDIQHISHDVCKTFVVVWCRNQKIYNLDVTL